MKFPHVLYIQESRIKQLRPLLCILALGKTGKGLMHGTMMCLPDDHYQWKNEGLMISALSLAVLRVKCEQSDHGKKAMDTSVY